MANWNELSHSQIADIAAGVKSLHEKPVEMHDHVTGINSNLNYAVQLSLNSTINVLWTLRKDILMSNIFISIFYIGLQYMWDKKESLF